MSSGADKIVSNINSEAQAKADGIIQEAQTKADDIIAKAQEDAKVESEKILADGGFTPSDSTGSPKWRYLDDSGKRICCFEFLAPDRIIKTGRFAASSATLVQGYQSNSAVNNPPLIDATSLVPEQIDYTKLVMASRVSTQDSGSVKPKMRSGNPAPPSAPSSYLSAQEMTEQLDKPLGKDQCMDFVKRLLTDLALQMQTSHGELIADCARLENGDLQCSSLIVERIAANHRISSATLDALIFALNFNSHLTIDWQRHTITHKENP